MIARLLGGHPQGREHLGAGFRAMRAGVGADLAMLVLVSVSAALTGASAAEGSAGGELRFQRLAVPRLIRPRHDATRGGTDRRAIQIETNTGDHALDVLLREACIRASGACLDAERAGVDASCDGVRVSRMLGVGSKHGAHN